MSVGEKYVSDVVRVLLEHGQKFIGIEVDNYKDWGTLDDWLSYKKIIRPFLLISMELSFKIQVHRIQ